MPRPLTSVERARGRGRPARSMCRGRRRQASIEHDDDGDDRAGNPASVATSSTVAGRRRDPSTSTPPIARTRCRTSSRTTRRACTCRTRSATPSTSSIRPPRRSSTTSRSACLPQHVVPAWDLKTLYVTNDRSNTLTPIDPATGHPGPTIPVDDPYNMYFTPDGKYAIVVAERLARLDFRDPHTFKLVQLGPRRLRRHRSHRLLRRRSLPDRELRVLRPAGEARRGGTERGRHDPAARRKLQAAGREARSDRARLLRRRHDPRRRVHGRRRHVHGDELHPDRRGRARLVREPRFQGALRDEPECRDHLTARLRDQHG